MTAWDRASYHPVDCGVHDRLLAAATLRREVTLSVLEEGGTVRETSGRIADVFPLKGVEYLRLETASDPGDAGGAEVRLDRILALDGDSLPTPVEVGSLRADDWPGVARILAEGIATGNATFETKVPSWEAWDSAHLEAGRVAARTGGVLVGWGALSPVSGRCVYGGVAEISVYVTARVRGRGVGRALLAALVQAGEEAGLWTLQAGIFPENDASLRIHRAAGFREVGRRERIGRLRGRWRDVILLERRSAVVGQGDG
jgi:L-amino acid N-acyltransferase YncA/transcriptional antiterminator Rof (Rho-off)